MKRRSRSSRVRFRSDRLAILAIVISLGSCVLTWHTAWKQQWQWQVVNLGRIDLNKVSFIFWRTYDESELKAVHWGYTADLMPLLDGSKVTKMYGLSSRLIAFDTVSRRVVPDITGITLADVAQSIENLNNTFDRKLVPAKQFQFQWEFRNGGLTEVKRAKIAIDSKMPDTGRWEQGQYSSPVDLAPAGQIFKISELTADPNQELPSKLNFKIRVDYFDVGGQHVFKETPVYFSSYTAAFNFGE